MVQFAEGHDFVLGPFFPGADARQGDQFLIGAGSGKVQGIETGFLAEVAVFIVGDDLRVVAFRRVNTGDVRFNVPGIQVFHNRNTLIALDDIVVSHIFQHSDGLVHTGLLHAFAQVLPFGGKLAAAFQDGHKTIREGIAASLGHGTDDPVQRNRHNPQGQPAEGGKRRHPLLQYGKIGVGIGLDCRLVNAQAFTTGFTVMIHDFTSLLLSMLPKALFNKGRSAVF